MLEQKEDTNRYVNPISVLIFSFALGIFLSSLVPIVPLISLLIIFVGLAILIDKNREVVLLSIIVVSFGLGTLRYAVKDFHQLRTPSPTGVVVSEPEDRENARRFVFLSDNSERVLVSLPLYTHVEYGDRVEVDGEFERPGMIEDFDYGKYLSKDDIYYTLNSKQLKVLSSGHGNSIKAILLKLKYSLVAHTKGILAEPHGSLLLGLIIAGRDALPKDILEEFRRAGVVHIVVLSGFNITLIAEFLRRVFQKFFLWARINRFPQAASITSIVGVILFVIMTGGEATVVRAALMAGVVILAKFFGRSYRASRALLFAGFLMLLQNPKILVFDRSFQLSFVATIGLIYLMPMFEKRLKWVTERWQLREIFAQTLSTQLAVLPLLIYSVGDVSLVSLPANLLILVVVPWAMLVGFVAILISYISATLAWPITYATYLLLSWILLTAHFFGTLPFAVFSFV